MRQEKTSMDVRIARRPLRFEICGLQRAMVGVMAASVVCNAAMYGMMLHSERKHQEELEAIQQEIDIAERIRDDAVQRYGALVLEMERQRLDEQQEAQEPDIDINPYQYVGECKITYYCCEQYPHICGDGDGLTATGIPVEPGIVAVDPSIIELGSKVIIDGQEYLAADTGGAVKGMHIDVCVEGHNEALELGTHTSDVWIVR